MVDEKPFHCIQETKVGILEQKFIDMDKRLERIENKLDAFLEKADEKYASKADFDRLNWRMWGLTIALITALIWAVVGFIFVK